MNTKFFNAGVKVSQSTVVACRATASVARSATHTTVVASTSFWSGLKAGMRPATPVAALKRLGG